ncbi:major histocompatibility complex class I-related gene protein-like isoform X2 [Pantherophis guttatus]|uniref:Major histocompatibility complex class I-related gene protein-like isoform X2 n=1 Tax=Pantherophis guttatus TaxID=94885 RepID=A0ABM3ZM14_PANGU|nr:major histocompatibility complex class I-related gene protein-like isoform X2 [Pantherophis guttatus]
MGLPVAALGLLSAAAVVVLRGGCGEGCAVKANASLCYHYLEVSEPSPEQPQFSIRIYLDDQPIAHFDSLTRKMKPRVPSMKEVEKEKFLPPEWVFRADLQELSELDPLAGGFHTWQAILGCELREDGSKGRFFRYGYDGMDFISLKNETFSWVAAQTQAGKFKVEWEKDSQWFHTNKDFLENTCIKWLKKYLSCRKETPKDTKPPVGTVTHKVVNDSLEVLICYASGFYSKEIQANWTRDGKVCQNETLHRNVVPNSDGTYYVWLSIEIDPKERDRFQCHLDHEGLQKPLVLPLKEETGWRIPVGIVIGGLILAVILFLIYKYRRGCNRKAKSSLEGSPSEILCLPTTSSRKENERLLNSSLQSEITLDDRTSDGGWSSQRAVEDSGSTLRRREGKQQPLRRSMSWAGELEALDKSGATESEESWLLGPKAERSSESHSTPARWFLKEEGY